MIRLKSVSLCCVLVICASMVSCGGGSSSAPVSEPDPPIVPAPSPAPQGLRTDDQLKTFDDSRAALVDNSTANWFAQNASIIRSLTEGEDFSDLSFLDATLQNKRLVMLGESSHGAKEYSQAKVRLIKYLHEQQDYNVLAFESGMHDCENSQRILDRSTPLATLEGCIFGVWHTQTLLELFEYIQGTQTSNAPLRITGFDVQPSGISLRNRAEYTAALVEKVSPDYAIEIRALERELGRFRTDLLAASSAADPIFIEKSSRVPSLSASYLELADYLLANSSVITADGEFNDHEVKVASQYIRTSPFYALQLVQRFDPDGGSSSRDKGMSENFISLATTLYPNDKIIGWAHNAHLRHQGTGFVSNGNMGALVHSELGRVLYTIGFYMYRGQHAFNDRSIQDIEAPADYSLESIFYSRRLAFLFLDIENTTANEPGAEWLDQTTPTWAWGIHQINLNLRDEYDGLVVIDTITPPDFL